MTSSVSDYISSSIAQILPLKEENEFLELIKSQEYYKIFKEYEEQIENVPLEEIEVKGIPTIINLAKNPTGANVSLRILNEDEDEKELLFVLNDNIADGFDVSWIWDINFDNLNHVSRIITSRNPCL